MADELPALAEGLLDDAQLQALFADFASRATVTGIALKGGEQARASNAKVSLEQARAQLASGAVHGVQIRYDHAGRCWCDTLLRTPEGVRLVRMDVTPP